MGIDRWNKIPVFPWYPSESILEHQSISWTVWWVWFKFDLIWVLMQMKRYLLFHYIPPEIFEAPLYFQGLIDGFHLNQGMWFGYWCRWKKIILVPLYPCLKYFGAPLYFSETTWWISFEPVNIILVLM